jgi:pimeloyl-ACP methyl ester carboxylesterase
MTEVRRGYVAAGGRRVHYRTAGSGPPLVLLHGSPGDSQMLLAEMAAAAPRFSCIALDTPGFGLSDALPGEVLTVADLAAATAEAMAALGLPPCRVYGTHTGAAIALELGVGSPERVTGLVLEGLPVFTDDEIETLFRGYFEPMVVDPLGGHLTRTWMRFRDQFTWFPWPSRDVRRLNPLDRPEPADIDLWVSMFYRSCATYGPAYRAACTYGRAAHRAAEALRVPAVYMASAEDMLFPHLDRLPRLQPGQRIERLAHDAAAKHEAIVAFAASLPAGPGKTPKLPDTAAGSSPALRFVDTAEGQVFVRCFGSPERPPLLLLHDAPGSGLALTELAADLAGEFHVLVADLPGNGESSAPLPERSVLDASADAIRDVADALALTSFAVAAVGCGAAVAARLALRGDPRLRGIVVDGVIAADAIGAEAIAPELPLSAEGAHWLRAWLIVRDGQIYAPWFDGRVATQRRTQGNFDAQGLHDQTCALMASRTSYHRLPREAWRFETRAALAESRVPVHDAAGRDLAACIRTTLHPHPTSHPHPSPSDAR